MGEERGFNVGVGGVDGSEKLVGLRFGNHGGLESADGDGARRGDGAEARQTFGVKEGAALVWRAGEEHDELAKAGEGDVEPLAGCAAVGIWENGRAIENVGLLEIVGRHGDAPGGGAGVESGDLRGVAAEGEREGFGGGFASEIVFSGPEAAHEDEHVSAGESGFDGGDEVVAAVADDGFEGDGNAERVELLSEIERVGVLTVGGEHLGADGDDFAFHKEVVSD